MSNIKPIEAMNKLLKEGAKARVIGMSTEVSNQEKASESLQSKIKDYNENRENKKASEDWERREKKFSKRIQTGLNNWYYKEFEKISEFKKIKPATLSSIVLMEWIEKNRIN